MVLRYDKLPKALFLAGVQLDVENDIANSGGGYSDIYMGRYRTQRVAVKRLRVFSSMEESKREEVKRVRAYSAIPQFTLPTYPNLYSPFTTRLSPGVPCLTDTSFLSSA